MISIIIPVYNGVKTISRAIKSVLSQSYDNWELLVVNDGSTDKTEEIIYAFNDERIKYFKQDNKGVSAARNVGLNNLKGDYFCFLDADDEFTEQSLELRVMLLEANPSANFSDGYVIFYDLKNELEMRAYKPISCSNPLPELLKLNDSIFMGNSWMFRNVFDVRFMEGLTHGEDLLFAIECANQGGALVSTPNKILTYHIHENGAMQNLKGLAEGYETISTVIEQKEIGSSEDRRIFKLKTKKIITKSYIKSGKYRAAVHNILRKW